MSNVKKAVAGLVLGAGALACGQALAGTTGTVAVTSEYLFRGLVSEGGAAVQGSLTWDNEIGVYAGAWASNSNVLRALGNELDLYLGWSRELGRGGLSVDLGVLYYLYSEDEEFSQIVPGQSSLDADYWEVYLGGSIAGLSLKVFYGDEYFGDFTDPGRNTTFLFGTNRDQEIVYVTLSYALTVKEGLDLTFQVGNSSGDGVENLTGEDYNDYSVTLSKDLGNGAGASFALVDSDLELEAAGATVAEDEPKFVVSFSKEFTL